MPMTPDVSDLKWNGRVDGAGSIAGIEGHGTAPVFQPASVLTALA